MAVKNHPVEPTDNEIDTDAKIILQMMMTKALHLKNIIIGISFQAKDGSRLDKIIDPTIVASLIRNIYETTAIFNLIYRDTKSNEEKEILFRLWEHSGLSYRQRFENHNTTIEGQDKLKNEKVAMDKIVKIIETNVLYKKLNEKNQKKIQNKLKNKDYLIRFENNEVISLKWYELIKTMGIKENFLDNIYNYFSLNTHPSHVAVFQFTEMFEKREEHFLEATKFNMFNAFCFFSIFIADYIKLFPSVLKTFNSIDLKSQIVINCYNTIFRGDNFSINDSLDSLDY